MAEPQPSIELSDLGTLTHSTHRTASQSSSTTSANGPVASRPNKGKGRATDNADWRLTTPSSTTPRHQSHQSFDLGVYTPVHWDVPLSSSNPPAANAVSGSRLASVPSSHRSLTAVLSRNQLFAYCHEPAKVCAPTRALLKSEAVDDELQIPHTISPDVHESGTEAGLFQTLTSAESGAPSPQRPAGLMGMSGSAHYRDEDDIDLEAGAAHWAAHDTRSLTQTGIQDSENEIQNADTGAEDHTRINTTSRSSPQNTPSPSRPSAPSTTLPSLSSSRAERDRRRWLLCRVGTYGTVSAAAWTVFGLAYTGHLRSSGYHSDPRPYGQPADTGTNPSPMIDITPTPTLTPIPPGIEFGAPPRPGWGPGIEPTTTTTTATMPSSTVTPTSTATTTTRWEYGC